VSGVGRLLKRVLDKSAFAWFTLGMVIECPNGTKISASTDSRHKLPYLINVNRGNYGRLYRFRTSDEAAMFIHTTQQENS